MSIARLSAGSGYRYLLRSTASADVARAAGESLTAYYAASGNPPGRWLGLGLAALGTDRLGGGLVPGAVVTEEAMAALYGSGRNPVTGERLGRPYPQFRSLSERIAEAVAGLPAELSETGREAAIAKIERHVRANPSRSAVAGYDLTFTVPKSASVLWALGDPAVQAEVVAAHRAALAGVLELVEARYLHTRTGKGSVLQVPAQGLIAAAFDHVDSRAGDPHLHTHVVVANKVQGPDGKWRSVDGQELYRAAVALSETYLDLFADQLSARLPVAWSWRERGPRRSPVFEIEGITDELLATFSQRSAQIGTHLDDLTEAFVAKQGREPSRAEVLRLRQRATLATRPDKQVRPLAEILADWRARATAATGNRPDELVDDVLDSARRSPRAGHKVTLPAFAGPHIPAPTPGRSDIDALTVVDALAEEVLTGIEMRRPTWTRANVLAEAARATRHLRAPDTAARIALLDHVVDAALARCVALDPPEVFHTPARFRRLDGTSMLDRPSQAAFTTTTVLDAEARLLAALDDLTAPAVPAAVLQGLGRPIPGQRLSPDQQAAITGIATSARRLDVLIGPAGTGKTRTLAILTRAWAHTHGPGSVLGLAPSAAAAAQLAAALRIPCENTAKWLHDHDTDELTASAGRPPLTAGNTAGNPAGMRAGMLVIVDEASLASTTHLDRLLQHATAAGAKLLLVGDDQQLGAVDAGGAFALLADTATEASTAHMLDSLWRFTHRWEAHATRTLRVGDPAVLAAYAQHGRLHDGDTHAMTEAAYQAWQADLAAGKASLLLAQDRDTVTALNVRARTDRHAAGHLGGPEAALHDGTACAAGDWIITRQNDRRLPTAAGGHVRNGAPWTVAAVHPDGSLDVIPREHGPAAASPSPQSSQPAAAVRLPAGYVADHVELGYATTIHRAQGATVDTAHVIARPGMTRQALYVAMTRGREANHAYVPTDGTADTHRTDHLTGRQILEQVVATDGREHSATVTLRSRQNAATSLHRLTAARDAMAAAVVDSHYDGDLERAVAEVNDLIRRRVEAQRAHGPRGGRLDPPHGAPSHDRPSIGGP